MSIAKSTRSCIEMLRDSILGVLLMSFVAVGVAVSESSAQLLFGDGSDGDHTVLATADEELTAEMQYENLTIEPGATLNTNGFVVRVNGTLTNEGTIFDNSSGGLGGIGGDHGYGDFDGPGTGGLGGDVGAAGGGFGAGGGGNGGAGGGGAGGAWDSNNLEAGIGGNGGQGGAGGQGGGRIRIYVRNLVNPGLVDANGQPGQPGGAGLQGTKSVYTEALIIDRDVAGGGGGGGGGGNGGDGGRVSIVYETLSSTGSITANGGAGGTGGGPGSGRNTNYDAGNNTSEYNGANGANFDADGGDGGRGERGAAGSQPGTAGAPGLPGAAGTVTLRQSVVCYFDSDFDGYGDVNYAGDDNEGSCDFGFVENNLDCDDSDDGTFPGSLEIVDDGIDQDCDGFDNVTCFADTDDDGYGDAGSSTVFVGSCGTGYVADATDNCPVLSNPGQLDNEGDGVGNLCDNCPDHVNPGQEDSDGDEIGDVCETCCIGEQRGDANLSSIGLPDLPTIGDISAVIDAKFISSTCGPKPGETEPVIACLDEADVNASAPGETICDDVTIGDISLLVDYLFITGPMAWDAAKAPNFNGYFGTGEGKLRPCP